MIRVGIDAGGTFTDCIAVGAGALDGWRRAQKRPSRPDDPAAVVLEALEALVPPGYAGPVELTFSTTAATNALLTRSGGPTVLLTTAGFEDVLEIGRQARPALYALHPVKAAPLVPAADRIGVVERATFDGRVLTALSDEAIEAACVEVDRRGCKTVAVSLLHAYAFPAHEARLAARLRSRGHAVSVSSEVCPLPREYERTSTTVIDAYVAPSLGATLATLAARGLTLRVMESSGGARARAAVRPARTVLSGPAAGVGAVEALARRRGVETALTVDIGGTSTDVAVVRGGRAARVDELAIDGLPIALPSLEVRTVGAGGGSIAWLDGGGALRVGPRSAGATPGPAAYGRGGTEPTLTDAHVVLGRLGAELCGGAVALDPARARDALGPIAVALEVGVEAAAAAVVAVADATVARALRAVAAGLDPARAVLVAYGGAAGLHVVEVARELGIGRVLVPTEPGLQCARGALHADTVVEAIAAWRGPLVDGLDAEARGRLAALRAEVERALDADEVAPAERGAEAIVRVRYAGQGIDGELELPADACTAEAFAALHERTYGHRLAGRAIEVVRLAARGVGRRAEAPPPPIERGWSRRADRAVWDGDVAAACARHRRPRLAVGARLEGPALVEEDSATLWLPAGARAVVAADRAIEIELG